MNVELRPTRILVHTVASMYVVGEIGSDFLELEKDERIALLRKIAEENYIDPENVDFEGLSDITNAETIEDFLRKGLEKYPEYPSPDFPDPKQGL